MCATARVPQRRHGQLVPLVHPRPTAERQSLRLDLGNGDCRLEGWIPLELQLDAWTDRAGAEALRTPPPSTGEFSVPERQVSVTAAPDSPNTQQRQLAGQPTTYASDSATASDAKQTVYATCVRRLAHRLPRRHRRGRPPRVDLDAATAAVAVAAAATEATRTGRTLQLTRSDIDPLREEIR